MIDPFLSERLLTCVRPRFCRECASVHSRSSPGAAEATSESGGGDVRIFGSIARGTDHPGSDVDLIVRLEPGRDIVDLLALEEELSELFTFDVDVIADGSTGAVIERARRESVPL